MSFRIQNARDFWSGIAFVATGVGFSWGALNYSFGNSAQPGPGYFPFGLGIVLALLGAAVLYQSLKTVGAEDDGKVGPWAWKPLLRITAAVALFGWALPVLGMFLTLPLLIVLTATAGDEFHWGEALLNAAVLTVGSWAIFVWGLKLTIPLWPAFLAH